MEEAILEDKEVAVSERLHLLRRIHHIEVSLVSLDKLLVFGAF